MSIRFFLGANTPHGFKSLYGEWMEGADRAYIIKGSPGCGKSGFMRRIALAAERRELPVEYIHCSGDAASLDGVCLTATNTYFVDGTAPHVVEPKIPYAVEQYLNLGAFVDAEPLRQHTPTLGILFAAHRAAYASVYRCLSAAHAIHENLRAQVLAEDVAAKIARRARGIIRRELSKGISGASVSKRYLNAITPRGEVVFWDTVESLCDRVYTLRDSYGLAEYALTPILTAALDLGQPVIACYSPLDGRLEHLLLPELKLGLVSVNQAREYPGEIYRHVRLDATVPPERVRAMRQKLRVLRKTRAALLEEASAALGQAKSIHDDMESYYVSCTDFTQVTALCDNMIRTQFPS